MPLNSHQDLAALGPRSCLFFNWPSGGGAVPKTLQIPETPSPPPPTWIFSFPCDNWPLWTAEFATSIWKISVFTVMS